VVKKVQARVTIFASGVQSAAAIKVYIKQHQHQQAHQPLINQLNHLSETDASNHGLTSKKKKKYSITVLSASIKLPVFHTRRMPWSGPSRLVWHKQKPVLAHSVLNHTRTSQQATPRSTTGLCEWDKGGMVFLL
jgi:hypothetical protein